ncbi:DUF1127 domain-containing protein [Roseibium sp.]|uniref:DUF1127 domain-containing protein n=1 Tax=Roseibium sp. TaxID=1936156 RepID=UPI003BAE2EE1
MSDQTLTPRLLTVTTAPRSVRSAGSFRHFLETLTRLLRRRRDRAHLSELPDYLLEDIGLTRADVPGRPPVGEGWR